MTDLAHSLAGFAHALRAGGVRLGSDALLTGNAAIAAVGVASREDVRAALRATLIRDPADLALFDHLFDVLFAGPSFSIPGSQPITPQSRGLAAPAAARRLAESLMSLGDARPPQAPERREADAAGTHDARERLAAKDFEQMTAQELAEVRRLIEAAPARSAQHRSRRWRPAAGGGGRLDLARMLRSRRIEVPLFREPRLRLRDCVLLVDISGSMSVYARMFLHLAHALRRRGGRVEVFTFATRLTRITREIATADPDLAMRAVGRKVPDWDGGTRLGESLREFNDHWARRVLGGGARVLLLSDGLEREGIELLDEELARLRRGSRELLWVNPLLRHAGYEPLAAGAAVLARHVRRSVPAHNAASLLALLHVIDGADIGAALREQRIPAPASKH